MKDKLSHFLHSLDLSAVLTLLGIILLFSGAVIVTLIAPNYLDPAWTTPCCQYQVQMYEIADPHFYISSAGSRGEQLQYVYHLKQGGPLLAFMESDTLKISAPKELEKYITRASDQKLKLTARVLLLRESFSKGDVRVLELYDPKRDEAFAVAETDGVLQDWTEDYILAENEDSRQGHIYIANPREFKALLYHDSGHLYWKHDDAGSPIPSLDQLKGPPFSFTSRKELIQAGEHLYAIEGCWYCHTDQTRTLVQDLVLNGSDSYPAPPSSPNEYIYQQITFPGTKRNGPDISRVGIKRPSRDWHKAHFWSPKTESRGSIMPSFRHFFDFDPRGTSPLKPGVPNQKFEAIYQYLMTKGTRITPPQEAWWLGKDPIQALEIIEGRRKIP